MSHLENNESKLKCDRFIKNLYFKFIIASPDADVFINSIPHFNCWKYVDLEELWLVSGKKVSQQTFPVHELINKMVANVIDILPTLHALTGSIFIMTIVSM